MFNTRTVIGLNDVLVGTVMGTIKVEPMTDNNDGIIVKSEGNEVKAEAEEDVMDFQSTAEDASMITPADSEEQEVGRMQVTTEAQDGNAIFGGGGSSEDMDVVNSHTQEHSNMGEEEIDVKDIIQILYSPDIVSLKSHSEIQALEQPLENNDQVSTEGRPPSLDVSDNTPVASSAAADKPEEMELPQTVQEGGSSFLPVVNRNPAQVEYEEWLNELLGGTGSTVVGSKSKNEGMGKRAKKKIKSGDREGIPTKGRKLSGKEFSANKNKEVVVSTKHVECSSTANKQMVSSTIDVQCSEHNNIVQNIGIQEEYTDASNIQKAASNDSDQQRDTITYNGVEQTCVTFETVDSVQSFMASTTDLPNNTNPFHTTKSVVIKPPTKAMHDDKDLVNFWDCVYKLFRLHGHLILSLTLDINGSYPVTLAYKWTRQLLYLMRNLRSLEIKYKPTEPETRIFTLADDLPELKHLESLNIQNAVMPAVITFSFLDKFASNLKTFQTTIKAWNEELAKLLKNLKNLYVAEVEVATDLNVRLQSLQKNTCVRNGLVSLTLELKTNVQPEELFEMIMPFKGLRELKLLLGDSIQNMQVSLVKFEPGLAEAKKISLPSIRTLTLSLNISQRSFGFVKWLPALESLHLEQVSPFNYGVVREETVQEIDVELRKCLARKSATKSRIWTLLPKVKLIKVEWDCQGDFKRREATTFRREFCG